MIGFRQAATIFGLYQHCIVTMETASENDPLYPLEWAEIGLKAEDNDAVHAALTARAHAVGAESVAVVRDLPRYAPAFPREDQMCGRFVSTDWHEFYCKNSHLMAHDPVAKHLFRSEQPIFWQEGHAKAFSLANRHEARFAGMVQDFGMRGSFAFSSFDRDQGTMTAVMLINLTRSHDFARAVLPHTHALQLAGHFLAEGLTLRTARDRDRIGRLSPRERDCLSWISVGMTTQAVADRMGLSDHTVNAYTRHAVRKLGAATRAQACVRAYILDAIHP